MTNELGVVTLILFILFSFLSYLCKHLGCVQYLHIKMISYIMVMTTHIQAGLPTITDIP